jgi:hypothetical protein
MTGPARGQVVDARIAALIPESESLIPEKAAVRRTVRAGRPPYVDPR